MRVPNTSGLSLRLGISRERLSITPGSRRSGKDTGRLVTWDCPLRTDSASWNSLESFIQLISFYNSCILPVSSRIVTRSSTNFILEIVSNVDPCKRFNSSISLRLFSWDFVPITVHKEVVDLVEVVRLLDEHDKFLLFETRSVHSTFDLLLLSLSASNSCFLISDWQSARICSCCLSRRVLICSLSELCLWVSWALETCVPSEQTTGLPILTWLTDDDRQGDKPSSWEWSARLRHASSSVLPMVTSS